MLCQWGTMVAEGYPPLMEVMTAVAAEQARSPVGVLVPGPVAATAKATSCSARVMDNCMSPMVVSGCAPGGSGEYSSGKVSSHSCFSLS